MRLITLYLRSRLAGSALVLLGLIAVGSCLALSLSNGDLYLFGAMLFGLPLAAAVVIAVGTRVPFGESEQTASYPLPLLRFGHLLALIGWAAGGLVAAALLFSPREMTGLITAGVLVQPSTVAWWFARNLVGFAGLGLLGSWWLGSGRGWVVVLVQGILTLTSGAATLFGWPLRPVNDLPAAVIACVLLTLGLAVIVRQGAGNDRSDTAVV